MEKGNVSVMLNKDGEGIVEIGHLTFKAVRPTTEAPIVHDLVMIIEGDVDCIEDGDYKNGDIYKVTSLDEDGDIYINQEWTDEEGNIWLANDEYIILQPKGMEEILFALQFDKGIANEGRRPFSQIVAEDDFEPIGIDDEGCEGCPSYEECHGVPEEEEEEDIADECKICPVYGTACEGKTQGEFDEDVRAEIQEEMEAEGFDVMEAMNELLENAKKFNKPDEELTRYEVIEKAENTLEVYSHPFTYEPTGQRAYFDFVPTADDVTAFMKEVDTGEVIAEGVCTYDEADGEYTVGRVIALFRASEEDIPNVLFNLPKA